MPVGNSAPAGIDPRSPAQKSNLLTTAPLSEAVGRELPAEVVPDRLPEMVLSQYGCKHIRIRQQYMLSQFFAPPSAPPPPTLLALVNSLQVYTPRGKFYVSLSVSSNFEHLTFAKRLMVDKEFPVGFVRRVRALHPVNGDDDRAIWSSEVSDEAEINNSHEKMSRLVTKPTMWLCAQSDQCLRLRSVGSFLYADSEDSDQTGRMPRLI